MSQFNKTCYLELLKLNSSELESGELFTELQNYRIMVEAQLIYNRRDEYISLLQEHQKELNTDTDLDFDLDFETAFFKFSELYDQNTDDLNLLENKILKEGITILDNFSIHPKSREFSDLITHILHFLDDDEGEISEEEYGIELEMTLSELQDYARNTIIFFGKVLPIPKQALLISFGVGVLASCIYFSFNPDFLSGISDSFN